LRTPMLQRVFRGIRHPLVGYAGLAGISGLQFELVARHEPGLPIVEPKRAVFSLRSLPVVGRGAIKGRLRALGRVPWEQRESRVARTSSGVGVS
jgi:hypothetical protein